MLLGCDCEQSDATSAYTQPKLGIGTKGPYIVTWVEVPISQWRPEQVAVGMGRPCCQPRLSRYGHPMSFKYWGNHFTEKLLKCDSEPSAGWACLFFHRRLKFILSVYVDDFKPVGKQESFK